MIKETEFRQTLFGDFGVLFFRIDEKAELMRIFNVTRAG